MRETWVWPLGWEDPLEKEMATHSRTLAWKILWMEEPGRLQFMRSQRVGHNWPWLHIPFLSSIFAWENPMDTGVWWAIVHGVAKSRTQVSMQAVQPAQWCRLHVILGLSESTPSDGRPLVHPPRSFQAGILPWVSIAEDPSGDSSSFLPVSCPRTQGSFRSGQNYPLPASGFFSSRHST